MRTGGRRGWRPLRTFSAGFNPLVLFGAGEQGGWWDPSDFSTMFQDSAGTTPVTAAGQPVGFIGDKRSGFARGAEIAPSSTSTTGWTAVVSALSANASGLTITNSGAAEGGAQIAGSLTVPGQAYEVLYDIVASTTASPNKGAVTVGGTRISLGTSLGAGKRLIVFATTANIISFATNSTVAGELLTIANVSVKAVAGNHLIQGTAAARPTLQQDASGYWYLATDGVDDGMATAASVDLTAFNNLLVCSGLTKNSDASIAVVFETGAAGSFSLNAPRNVTANFGMDLRGGGLTDTIQVSPYVAPYSAVATASGDLSTIASIGAQAQLRINGVLPTQAVTGTGPIVTGALANEAFNLGRRSGGTLFFNGRMYGLIVRASVGATAASQVAQTERYMGGKMGIAL